MNTCKYFVIKWGNCTKILLRNGYTMKCAEIRKPCLHYTRKEKKCVKNVQITKCVKELSMPIRSP